MGRDTAVGIATRYELDAPASNPGGGEIFRTHRGRPWGPPNLLYDWYSLFHRCKAAGMWRWPPTPSGAEVKQRVQLYFSPPPPPGLHGLF